MAAGRVEALGDRAKSLPQSPSDSRMIAERDAGESNVLDLDVDWREYFDEERWLPLRVEENFRVLLAGTTGALFVCLHGGGACALSFALLAQQLKPTHRVVAFDFRGHGASTVQPEDDLSMDTLCTDALFVLKSALGDLTTLPPLILVGHSLGGAVAVNLVKSLPTAQGLIVLDVVEGTAMASFGFINSALSRRPSRFRSVQNAVDWAVKSMTLRNRASAIISIPPTIREVVSQPGKPPSYVWRTDLLASEQYWKDWYSGLSEKFLGVSVPKMLVLAGTDRLDKTLMIGQMQGKFQLVLLPGCGHHVHEEQVQKVAQACDTFATRYGVGL